MTPEEFLDTIRHFEIWLRSPRVQEYFRKQSRDVRDRFAPFRQEVSILLEKLTNAELERIACRLDALSDDLNSGIGNLKAKLTAADKGVKILEAIDEVAGVFSQIMKLVA